jgi:ABC-2 type transport system ATP-binding protein
LSLSSDGRILAEGSPETLGDRHRLSTRILFGMPDRLTPSDLPPKLAELARPLNGRILIETTDAVTDLFDLSRWSLEGGRHLRQLEVRQQTLEDIYLALTRGGGWQ